MTNRPVYRHPPRSHAYSCRCDRCLPFKSRPLQSGAWIWVAIPVVSGIFWVLSAPLRIWHTTGSDGKMHPDTATYIAYGVPAGLVVLLLMFFSIRAADRRKPAQVIPPTMPSPGPPPRGRRWSYPDPPASVPPMSSLPPTAAESRAMATPSFTSCAHDRAEPVGNDMLGRLAWLCPDCDAQLDEDWEPPRPPPPPPAGVPVAGYSWNWHCTCGRARSGHARTQQAAEANIVRGIAAHQGYGHRYEYRWWPGG